MTVDPGKVSIDLGRPPSERTGFGRELRRPGRLCPATRTVTRKWGGTSYKLRSLGRLTTMPHATAVHVDAIKVRTLRLLRQWIIHTGFHDECDMASVSRVAEPHDSCKTVVSPHAIHCELIGPHISFPSRGIEGSVSRFPLSHDGCFCYEYEWTISRRLAPVNK